LGAGLLNTGNREQQCESEKEVQDRQLGISLDNQKKKKKSKASKA
jgi:hypothetical protein